MALSSTLNYSNMVSLLDQIPDTTIFSGGARSDHATRDIFSLLRSLSTIAGGYAQCHRLT